MHCTVTRHTGTDSVYDVTHQFSENAYDVQSYGDALLEEIVEEAVIAHSQLDLDPEDEDQRLIEVALKRCRLYFGIKIDYSEGAYHITIFQKHRLPDDLLQE